MAVPRAQGPLCSRRSAARQHARYNRRNATCRSAFAKSDAMSEWVRNNPDLPAAWALNCSVTTAETAAKLRHRHIDGELAKIGEGWLFSVSSANTVKGKTAAGAPRATSALRTA